MRPEKDEYLPVTWYALLAFSIAFGFCAYSATWLDLPALEGIKHAEREISWAHLLGVLCIGVPTAHLLTSFALIGTKHLFRLDGHNKREHLWPPALVGVMEGLMYPAALLMGKGEFIGVWLALKVAGQWGRWSVNPASPESFSKSDTLGSDTAAQALEKIHESVLGQV